MKNWLVIFPKGQLMTSNSEIISAPDKIQLPPITYAMFEKSHFHKKSFLKATIKSGTFLHALLLKPPPTFLRPGGFRGLSFCRPGGPEFFHIISLEYLSLISCFKEWTIANCLFKSHLQLLSDLIFGTPSFP